MRVHNSFFLCCCSHPIYQPKKVKNVTTDVLGKKYGRVHMERQDLTKMATKKMKGLKRTRPEAAAEGSSEDNKASKKARVEE